MSKETFDPIDATAALLQDPDGAASVTFPMGAVIEVLMQMDPDEMRRAIGEFAVSRAAAFFTAMGEALGPTIVNGQAQEPEEENAIREGNIMKAALVPIETLFPILAQGITDSLSVLDGRSVTIEIVEPDNIVGEVFDNRVRMVSEDTVWFEAIVSLTAAKALAALIGLTERRIQAATGPIGVEAKLIKGATPVPWQPLPGHCLQTTRG